MSGPLPFPPPGRVLGGQELQEVARGVGREERLWGHLLRHRSGDRGYAQVHLDGHLGVRVLEWTREDHDTGHHGHDRSAGAVHVARGAIRHEHLRLGHRPIGSRVPAGEGFRSDETFIHRVRLEPGEGFTVTLHAYSPPLERAGQYDEDGDGLLHRVPTSSAGHLSPEGRQGTPSSAPRDGVAAGKPAAS